MNVTELIAAIKKRPLFFLLSYSIYEFDAFLRGYYYYQFSHQIEKNEEDNAFEEFKTNWLRKKLGLNGNPSYIQCLMFESNNASEALDKFFEHWERFTNTDNEDMEQTGTVTKG